MGAVDAELITIRMRLSGGQEVAYQAKAAAGGIAEVGTAAAASAAETTKATTGIRGAMGRMMGSAGQMRSVGRTWTTKFTLPVVAGAALAVKSALDFRSQMELLHTQAGMTAGNVQMLSKQVLAFASSGQSTHGPGDLATALYHIASGGFKASQAMGVLHAAEALATTGHADLEQTTNALVGALNSGIKGTKNMAGTVGTLNAIVGAGNMRMDDLTSAMGTGLLKRSQALGLSLPQVGAALATMTRQGQPATASATRFTMAMNLMQSPTDKAKGALEAIGISADKLGTLMQKGDLPGAFELLRKHLDALGTSAHGRELQSQAVSAIFGGGRTSGGIQSIITSLDQYQGTLKQIQQQGTPKTFEELHKAAQEDPAAQLAAAWSQLRAQFVNLGNTLIPVVIPALKTLATILGGMIAIFNALPGPVQAFIVGGILIAAIFGPLVWMLGAVAGAIDAIAVAFGIEEGVAASAFIVTFGWIALIIAVGVAFYLLYKKVGWFHNAVDAVFGFIKAHWPLLLTILTGPIGLAVVLIAKHFGTVKTVAVGVFGVVKDVIHAVGGAIAWVIDKAKKLIDFLNQIVDKIPSIHLPGSGGGGGILGKVAGVANSVANPGAAIVNKITGKAVGGPITTTGYRVVGEMGPELLRLPAGARVHRAEQSRSMVRGSPAFGETVRRLSDRPIQLVLKRAGKRIIAESVVEEQENAEALA